MRPRQDNPYNAVVIVAHPDDEVIWCGGLILQRPEWRWTVLSLCRRDDPDRCPKFKRVCKLLRVRGLISDLDDSDPPAVIHPGVEIASRIVAAVGETPWDLCITHGDKGEYGHHRHKEVHREVRTLIDGGILECGELWTFAYDCDGATGICRPGPRVDLRVELTEEQLGEKKRVVREEYGYSADSFEVRACTAPECFQRHLSPNRE